MKHWVQWNDESGRWAQELTESWKTADQVRAKTMVWITEYILEAYEDSDDMGKFKKLVELAKKVGDGSKLGGDYAVSDWVEDLLEILDPELSGK